MSTSSSTYADATNAAMEHLEHMSSLHPDLAEKYNTLSDLYSRKLWHQLTSSLLDFVSSDESSSSEGSGQSTNLRTMPETGGNSYLALYDRVVLSCDSKLNQLRLAQIASAVATSLVQDDTPAARAVLENLLEKRSRLGPAASLYVESKLALLDLRGHASSSSSSGEDEAERKARYESVKEILTKGAKTLQEMEGESVEAVVPSAFYGASTAYRKVVGPPEAFYREALMYLNYTPVESMTDEERYTLATDLSLAALTGDGVFNFGEVVATPILSALNGTPNAWLMELMHCFAHGDVDAFTKITEASADAVRAQPALVSRAVLVKEKITLLALVNMVFERPSAERTLTFEEIADRTRVGSTGDVEMVVMRALSLGLIKGSMDQVDGTVSVTWVMPRVLNEAQLRGLASRFGEWAVRTSKSLDYMKEHTPGLVA